MKSVALICCGSDMANVELDWVVEGVIQPRESVEGMLRVVEERGEGDNGTFWCWDGRVSISAIIRLDQGLSNTKQSHPW